MDARGFAYLYTQNDIRHHGVKGMKWGKHLMTQDEPKTPKPRTQQPPSDDKDDDVQASLAELMARAQAQMMEQANSIEQDANAIKGNFANAQNLRDYYNASIDAYSRYQNNPAFKSVVDSTVKSYMEDAADGVKSYIKGFPGQIVDGAKALITIATDPTYWPSRTTTQVNYGTNRYSNRHRG